jgi:short subunit dehydrogenase-like uncharacterized protein
VTARAYDVVLLGATGFTGQLVAEHLATRMAGTAATWAIAGRNRGRLDSVRDRVAALGSEPVVEVVDVTDPTGLRDLASRTTVLATTVGPYVEHGEPVVAACIDGGAHYCDITGEPAFVDRLLDAHDGPAREAGVKVVNCCGFDSIPADLGARFTVAQLPDDAPLTVRAFVRARGTASGGTWQSAIKAMAAADLRGVTSAPRPRQGDDGRRARVEALRLRRVQELDAWGVPMPVIDPTIVLRSARALSSYGPAFTYGQYARVRRLPTVVGMVGGVGMLASMAKVKPTRDLLLRVRQSGDGPTPAQRARSWFEVTFVGEGGGQATVTRVAGGDPGYGETSVMLGEAALSLAFDDLPDVAGVVTTAQAFEGGALQSRLEAQGIRFEVVR